MLSVVTRKGVTHFNINIAKEDSKPTSYEINGAEKTFNEISELLKFYKKSPVSQTCKGIGDYLECAEYQQEQHTHSTAENEAVSS